MTGNWRRKFQGSDLPYPPYEEVRDLVWFSEFGEKELLPKCLLGSRSLLERWCAHSTELGWSRQLPVWDRVKICFLLRPAWRSVWLGDEVKWEARQTAQLQHILQFHSDRYSRPSGRCAVMWKETHCFQWQSMRNRLRLELSRVTFPYITNIRKHHQTMNPFALTEMDILIKMIEQWKTGCTLTTPIIAILDTIYPGWCQKMR